MCVFVLDKNNLSSYFIGMGQQDMYIILESLRDDGYTLRAMKPSMVVDFFFAAWLGDTEAGIEAVTTIFRVDLAGLSRLAPILPPTFFNATFWMWPSLMSIRPITDEIAYLDSWEFDYYTLPLSLLDGYSPPVASALWRYKTKGLFLDDGSHRYLDNQESRMESESVVVNSSTSGLSPASASLWLFNKPIGPPIPGIEKGIIEDTALDYHALSSPPDLLQYSLFPDPDESWRWYLMAAEDMPDGIDYKGGNVWNISPEFSDLIQVDSGGWGLNYYYILSLRTGTRWPEASQRRTFPGVSTEPPAPIFPLLPPAIGEESSIVGTVADSALYIMAKRPLLFGEDPLTFIANPLIGR